MPLITQDWGEFQATDSYQMKLEDKTYGNFIDLSCGYGLDTLNYELTDAVNITTYCMERGRLVPHRVTARPARVLQATADLLLPEGKPAWSAVHAIAGKNCSRNVFLCYNCAQKPQNSHFIRFPDVIMDQVQRTSKLIEQTDNPAPLTAKTTMHFSNEMTYYAQKAVLVQEVEDNPALYAVAFALPQCADCFENDHDFGYYGGVDITQYSNDGFSTGADLAGLTFTGQTVRGIYVEGRIIIVVGTNTTPTPDVPFIKISRDGGVSFTDVTPSGLSASITILYAIVRSSDAWYVAGNNGYLAYSRDGYHWTALSTGGFATGIYRALAYDKSSDTVYVAGQNQPATPDAVALSIQGTTVANISSQVNGAYSAVPDAWHAVAVLDADHVVFGGTAGSFAENRYVSEGGLFSAGTVGSSSNVIAAVDGDPWTTIVASDDILYRRSVCNDLAWDVLEVIGTAGVQDSYTAIRVGDKTFGVNQLVAVTGAGEIVRIVPMTPDGL